MEAMLSEGALSSSTTRETGILTTLPERVALSWSVATGVMVGGLWFAVNEHLAAGGFLFLMTVLFCVGAMLGYVHGGILGLLGRPADMGRREAFVRLVRAAPLEVPALTVGWLVAAWIALTPVAGARAPWSLSAGVVLGWGGALAIFAWAAIEGWAALRGAYARWPRYRLGTAVLSVTFLGLAFTFIERRPAVWGTDARITTPGAIILALTVTVWVVSPLVIMLLQLERRRSAP